jgi:hypothetical protein
VTIGEQLTSTGPLQKGVYSAANEVCGVKPDVQAIFCRRPHQPKRPTPAKIMPD